MVSLRAMFFCDDVRQEIGNKLTAVGLYGEFIAFPPGQQKILLPKFAAVFIVMGLKTHASIGLRQQMSVTLPGQQPKGLVGEPLPMVHDPGQDEQNIVFQVSPLVLPPGDCAISAVVELTIGDEIQIFRNTIDVKRIAMIAGVPPVLPPGADMN